MFLVFSIVICKNKANNGKIINKCINFNIYYTFCMKIVVLMCKSGCLGTKRTRFNFSVV